MSDAALDARTVADLVSKLREDPDQAAEVIGVFLRGFDQKIRARVEEKLAWAKSFARDAEVAAAVDLEHLVAVYHAACAWRDSGRVPDALVGEIDDLPEQRLIAAIDAARKARA